ncbi:MAG: protein translocase subunit SecD, partial [Candidatus Aminicenantes bacterium]|nr:protein translocase subunit SecD [Candidatus Aminicenantes bacterium]
MKKNLLWRAILVGFVIILAVILFYPPKKKIHFGLDLKGGMHLTLQVVTDDAVKSETDRIINIIRDELKEKNIDYEIIPPGKIGEFSIQNFNPDKEDELKELLDDFKDWNYSIIGNSASLSIESGAAMYYREQSVKQAIETLWNRVDEMGLSEPTIQRQGGYGTDRIIVELPGVED